MTQQIHTRLFAVALLLTLGLFHGLNAQTVSSVAATTARDPLAALPASDMIVNVDMRRIMNEALPRLLVNAPATRARMNADLDKMKAQSGFDLRSVDRVVIGIGGFDAAAAAANPRDAMPGKIIAVMSGSFNAPVLVAAARLVAGTKTTEVGGSQIQEEAYGGKTIYTMTIDNKTTAATTSSPVARSMQLSLVALDDHTVAVGLPASVRETIDAQQLSSINPANAELLAMATNSANPLIGIGANVKAFMRPTPGGALIKTPRRLETDQLGGLSSANQNNTTGNNPMDEITKTLQEIQGFFLSFGMGANDFNMDLVARTNLPEQAQKLSGMLSMLQSQASSAPDPQARRILGGVKISAQSNELRVHSDVPQSDINQIFTDKTFGPNKPTGTTLTADEKTTPPTTRKATRRPVRRKRA